MTDQAGRGRGSDEERWRGTEAAEPSRHIPRESIWMSTNGGHARSVYRVLRLTADGVKVCNITRRGPRRLRGKVCVIPVASFLSRHERVR